MKIYDRHTREFLLEIPGSSLAGLDVRVYDLRYADLSDQNLQGANFEGMNIEEIELSHCNLRGANLSRTNLTEAILTDADLRGANLKGAKLSMTTFVRANLEDADLSEIVIEGIVNFGRAVARRTAFRNIKNLSGSIFWNTDCSNADFEGSDFGKVNEIDRAGVILTGTIFAHLTEKKL